MIDIIPHKDEQVVEYILWMWQAEDLIRAFEFNPVKIDEFVNSQIDDEKQSAFLRDWYHSLLRKMKRQKLERKGHLSELQNIMLELIYLHNTLLQVLKDSKYIELHKIALPHLESFKSKSNSKLQDVDACIQAMYGMLLLNMQKKEISDATQESMETFKNLLQYLGSQYYNMRTGSLKFDAN